ncbi:hypothetical protein WT33_14895 [Burkholderia stagnalis]|nr:hypothetical protein WT33_14895 [Burkholderia stagnalis]
MSVAGIVSCAPAATACAIAASTSGTYRCRQTAVPFSAFGPSAPCSGISSTSISVESPMLRQACASRPFGAGRRIRSTAPNARL